MIPVRLNLRNFMCYTDVHQPLVFDGIHVACLSGLNGHGKSALLDAITWVLWGKSRARSADELVNQGTATEMEVEFEFRLGEHQYRVIRKRNRRGRGQSMLELAVRDNGAYRPLTGNSVGDTERQIRELLRMSYETFTNSSFILQGRADSFTTKTPAERKQILAEILDLSFYDQLEDRAKQRAAERNEQQAVLRQQIQDDDRELEEQPRLGEQQATLEAAVADLEHRLKLTEARYEAVRERLSRLQAGQRELIEVDRRLAETRNRAGRQRALLEAAEAALTQAVAVLAREQEIERAYAELVDRRKDVERLATIQAEHGRLTQEAARLERIVAQARGRLEGRLHQLRGQLAAVGTDAARLEEYQQELTAARLERDALEQLEARRSHLEGDLRRARERYGELKAHREGYANRLEDVRKRQSMLGDSPTCPVCQTPLGEDRHRNVVRQYRREEEHFADLARKAERDLSEMERLGKSLRSELEELAQRLERRKVVQQRVEQAERALVRAQEQIRQLHELNAEIRQVESDLQGAAFARRELTDLETLQRQIAGLAYDPHTHKTVAEAVSHLSQYEALRHELLEARRVLTREREAREEARRALAELGADEAAAEKRRVELLAETAELTKVQDEAAAAETELREQRIEYVSVNQDLGAVRQRLATMEFTAQRRRERLAELDRVLKERSLYQELAQAFGKKGLQAMLIETAIPELQDEANRLLSLMTDGRMHVSFETQRSSRSGDSQIETLDIVINDERGARPYELYSGGEAFRVNFAIRIALSKLLARRAGARLQTLVIDEGFGTLDEQGKERLVEAIKVIQDEFEKILVITHLPDLKDLFPVRIEVAKTPLGSVIEVS